MFEVPKSEYPSLRYTVGGFTFLGLLHGVAVNLLCGRPLYFKPLQILYRTASGAAIGYVVHGIAPVRKYAVEKEVEWSERMEAWERGVRERRAMEEEALGEVKRKAAGSWL